MFTPPKNPTVAPLNPLARAAGEAWTAAFDAANAIKEEVSTAGRLWEAGRTQEARAAYQALLLQEGALWGAADVAYGQWMAALEQENAAANCTRVAA